MWNVKRINSLILNNYDYFVNNLNCKYAWKCNQSVIHKLYQKNIEKNHLEIGPGTGYFLKPYNFDNLSLIDVNKDILNKSHYNLRNNCNNINLYQHNIFIKNNKLDNLNINSVGLTYVLHCVPGKLDYLLNNLVENLNCNNYNIFGATVIPNEKDLLASTELFFLNKTGIFDNLTDNIKDLEKFCYRYPSQFYLNGNVLIFNTKIT